VAALRSANEFNRLFLILTQVTYLRLTSEKGTPEGDAKAPLSLSAKSVALLKKTSSPLK